MRGCRTPGRACIATAGPGATNLITGIANAYAERLPVLAITGETSTYIFGRGGLQESSGRGRRHRPGRAVRQHHPLSQAGRAHRLSGPGAEPGHPGAARARPGAGAAVHPLQRAEGNGRRQRARADSFPTQGFSLRRRRGVAELAELLRAARYPVIVAGYGCIRADAREVVADLSETLQHSGHHQPQGQRRRRRRHALCRSAAWASPPTAMPTAISSSMPTC